MNEQNRVHYALGYLSGAMALWAALEGMSEREGRIAWLRIKARDMVTHDRILTAYPREAAAKRAQEAAQKRITEYARRQAEGMRNVYSSGGYGYGNPGMSIIQNPFQQQ